MLLILLLSSLANFFRYEHFEGYGLVLPPVAMMHKEDGVLHFLLPQLSCTFHNSSKIIIDPPVKFLPLALLEQHNLSRLSVSNHLDLHLHIALLLHSTKGLFDYHQAFIADL